jgi:hypothetical protein
MYEGGGTVMDKRLMAESLIKSLRAAGVILLVEDGRVRGRSNDGQKLSLYVREMGERLLPVQAEAVAFLQAETNRSTNSEPLPGMVFERLPLQEVLSIGDVIKAGKAELIGKVIYHKRSHLCDMVIRPLEAKDGNC